MSTIKICSFVFHDPFFNLWGLAPPPDWSTCCIQREREKVEKEVPVEKSQQQQCTYHIRYIETPTKAMNTQPMPIMASIQGLSLESSANQSHNNRATLRCISRFEGQTWEIAHGDNRAIVVGADVHAHGDVWRVGGGEAHDCSVGKTLTKNQGRRP